jgi:hypothetical protein
MTGIRSNNHSTWTGCVEDRGNSSGPDTVGNYDTNAVAPSTATNSTLYPAEQYGSCPQAAMQLNYDWSGMTSLVNAMSPNGSTNQAIGLQLGWLSLTGGGPFYAPPMDSSYTYTQVIILLNRRLEHPGPLVRRWLQSRHVGRRQDRCARAADVQQHQGGRHHALHDPGEYRRRSDLHAAAGLRELGG